MVDLKEFLEKQEREEVINPNGSIGIEEGNNFIPYTNENVIIFDDFKYNLGMFFWERGAKQFVEEYKDYIFIAKSLNCYSLSNDLIIRVKEIFYILNISNQDFLDCVACLGEQKVKELIKELEKEVKE